MKKLRDEINEMLDIFDAYGIPEEKQRWIIVLGASFSFSPESGQYADEHTYDCFKVARFLKFCKDNGIIIDANELYNSFYSDAYTDGIKEIVYSFEKYDAMSQNKLKK